MTDATSTIAPAVATIKIARGGRTKLYARRFFRNRIGVIGLIIFAAVVLFALIGGFFTDYTYTDTDFMSLGVEPGVGGHLLGTNDAGNDLYAQLVHGLQRSLIIAITVSLVSTAISAIIGGLAAYIGGTFEKVTLGIIHFLLVIPAFLYTAMVTQSVGGDWKMLIVVLIVFGWMFTARMIWTLGRSVREREFVTAARYMALGPTTIVVRHILPNLASFIVVQFTFGIVGTVMAETGLSFLGFGVKIPDISLGALLSNGTSVVSSQPWLFYYPAGVLTLLTISVAFIADGLRDALDPNSNSGGKA